jgi:hypothetical protein
MSASDDVAFYEERAEHDLDWATKAPDPGVARIHYALAGLYLRRAMRVRDALDLSAAGAEQIAQEST